MNDLGDDYEGDACAQAMMALIAGAILAIGIVTVVILVVALSRM